MGKSKQPMSFEDIIKSNFQDELVGRYAEALSDWEENECTMMLPTNEEHDDRCWVMQADPGEGPFCMQCFMSVLAYEFILKMSQYRPLEPVDIDGVVSPGYHVRFAWWEPEGDQPRAGWARMTLDEDAEAVSMVFSSCDGLEACEHDLYLALYEAMHGLLLVAASEAAADEVSEFERVLGS